MSTVPSKIPHVVIERVADEIATQFSPFPQELEMRARRSDVNPDTEQHYAAARASRTLLARMSLVHRSWTAASQLALHRRVIIRSFPHLQTFCLSPFCGRWTQEFAYIRSVRNRSEERNEGCSGEFEIGKDRTLISLPAVPERRARTPDASKGDGEIIEKDVWKIIRDERKAKYEGESIGATQVARESSSIKAVIARYGDTYKPYTGPNAAELLLSALSRLPNLRHLACLMHHEFVDLSNVLDSLRGRDSLRALWLAGPSDIAFPAYSLRHLCLVVPTLQNLSFLAISFWHDRFEPGDAAVMTKFAADIATLCPPASLKVLRVEVPGYPLKGDIAPLEWLSRPRDAFALTHLYISDGRDSEIPDYGQIFHACLPSLDTVLIPNMKSRLLRKLLERCHSLRSLYLYVPDTFEGDVYLILRLELPQTLENLTIAECPLHDQLAEERLYFLLQSHAGLKRLQLDDTGICRHLGAHSRRGDIHTFFPTLSAACAKAGIEFSRTDTISAERYVVSHFM